MTTLLRYFRQVVAPTGRHRARPLLLPDEPIPPQAAPVPHEDSTDTPEPTGASDE